MFKKLFFLTLFIVIASASQAYCDTIYLKNGRFLKGKIIRQTRVSVTIQRKTGKQKVMRVNIKRITRSRAAVIKQAPAAPAENIPLAEPGDSAAAAPLEEGAATAVPEEDAAAAAPEESAAATSPEDREVTAAPDESAPAAAEEDNAAAGITQAQWNAERLAKQNLKMWTWGIEAGGDMWTMDAGSLGKLKTDDAESLAAMGYTPTQTITQGSTGAGTALFVERGKKLRVGLSAGYNVLPEVGYKISLSSSTLAFTAKLSNTAYAVPITMYAKWKYSDKTRFFAGAGAAYIKTETKKTLVDNGGTFSVGDSRETSSAGKWVPGLTAGCELFLGGNLSLSAGLKYMFSGKIDTSDKDVNYDFSGLRINLTARYYFGGR